MEIYIDGNLCSGCGLCTDICPDIFKMDEENNIVVMNIDIPDEFWESCQDACNECPENAISIDNIDALC